MVQDKILWLICAVLHLSDEGPVQSEKHTPSNPIRGSWPCSTSRRCNMEKNLFPQKVWAERESYSPTLECQWCTFVQILSTTLQVIICIWSDAYDPLCDALLWRKGVAMYVPGRKWPCIWLFSVCLHIGGIGGVGALVQQDQSALMIYFVRVIVSLIIFKELVSATFERYNSKLFLTVNFQSKKCVVRSYSRVESKTYSMQVQTCFWVLNNPGNRISSIFLVFWPSSWWTVGDACAKCRSYLSWNKGCV